MIRLTEVAPPYCVVCFNQQPELRHIDMDAQTDRGWTDIAGQKISLDNIVICENCAREAGHLIDMTSDEDIKRKLREKEAESEKWKREAKKAQDWSDRLEEAFDHRPTPIKIDHRLKPREREPA